jgi:hypothetical protein
MILKRALLWTIIGLLTNSAAAQSVSFTVTETAGLRRFSYPVTASLECPRGSLLDAESARLTDGQKQEVPAQFTVMSNWPDGTVRGLDIDLAPSAGPLETQTYHVELGQRPTRPARAGLSVTETADELLVASAAIQHRIRRDGNPLLNSIAFGDTEFIGADGIRTSSVPSPVEVVKRGPFNVTLKLGPVRLEYVNTKSWVKITQVAPEPRALTVDAHFQLTELPLLWDVGVGSWLYGTLKKSDEVMTLHYLDSHWIVSTGQPATPFALAKSFDGCGHLADGRKVAAFGILHASPEVKTELAGNGHVRMSAKRKELVTYFHVVKQPIPVTAVTSPQAMIAPLEVRLIQR